MMTARSAVRVTRTQDEGESSLNYKAKRANMHLHLREIHGYLGRNLDERTLDAIDAQASVSLPWTLLLAGRALDQTGWERRGLLGRLVRVDRRHR